MFNFGTVLENDSSLFSYYNMYYYHHFYIISFGSWIFFMLCFQLLCWFLSPLFSILGWWLPSFATNMFNFVPLCRILIYYTTRCGQDVFRNKSRLNTELNMLSRKQRETLSELVLKEVKWRLNKPIQDNHLQGTEVKKKVPKARTFKNNLR